MSQASWRTPTAVLVCGGLILTLSMGVRHTFGLFLQPMTVEHGWSRETFAFAIALQNLVWGFAQPFAGMIADRHGAGRVLVGGAILYVLGLALMTQASTGLALSLSAGLLIGLGLAGTTFGVIYGVIGRTFPPERRSQALGVAGAAGSFGLFAMLPFAQTLMSSLGWLSALLVLAATAALMAPLASALVEDRPAAQGPQQSIGHALAEAGGHRGFWLLCWGFFVCGFQVVFIAAHLPAYLGDLKFGPEVGMMALALIGLFNILGTYGAGWLGGRYTKKYLLSGIYILRAIAIIAFITLPITTASVYAFAAVMGVLWLSTVPLTNGVVSQIFGVSYLATLFGIVFLFHQLGSFLGVWLGGYLYDLTGSYQVVWIIAIGLSAMAAVLNWPIDDRPVARLRAQGAAA
ncbi:MAG TPA: MFS transporter [Burkholderiales bacterium]|nr:MFS transporter [Burkholderiales bacterium]